MRLASLSRLWIIHNGRSTLTRLCSCPGLITFERSRNSVIYYKCPFELHIKAYHNILIILIISYHGKSITDFIYTTGCLFCVKDRGYNKFSYVANLIMFCDLIPIWFHFLLKGFKKSFYFLYFLTSRAPGFSHPDSFCRNAHCLIIWKRI